MNTDYWNKFYSDIANTNPSTFAKMCLNYISPNDTLLDVGCGDGRDSTFFAQRVKKVISIDNSSKTIENLQKNNELDNNEHYIVDINSLETMTI
jgi:tellurite methyltransferase